MATSRFPQQFLDSRDLGYAFSVRRAKSGIGGGTHKVVDLHSRPNVRRETVLQVPASRFPLES